MTEVTMMIRNYRQMLTEQVISYEQYEAKLEVLAERYGLSFSELSNAEKEAAAM